MSRGASLLSTVARCADAEAALPEAVLRGATPADLEAAYEADAGASSDAGPAPDVDEIDRQASRGLWGGRLRLPERVGPSALQIVSLDESEADGSAAADSAEERERQFPVVVERCVPEAMRGYRWLEMLSRLSDPLFLLRKLDAELSEAIASLAAYRESERAVRSALVAERRRPEADWKRLLVDAGARFYGAQLLDATAEATPGAGVAGRAARPDEPEQLVFYLGRGAFAHLALAPAAKEGSREYVAHYYAPSSLRMRARAALACRKASEGK